MKNLKSHLEFYDKYHSNKTNKLTHWIGVPCVVVALLMLLNWISIDIAAHWKISFAWFLVVAALIYYYMLNVRLAVLATVVLVVLTFVCALLAGPTPSKFSGSLFLILMIVGVALQIIGHTFEANKPKIEQGVNLFIIGPLFWLIEVVSLIGFGKFFDINKTTNP